MSLTVDANIWLAAADPHEPSQDICARFLTLALSTNDPLESPLLLQVEIAGATSRKTGNSDDARKVTLEIVSIAAHRWHALDEYLASAASALAGELRLRGADAVYAAVAAYTGSTLITLDRELQARTDQHISVMTPDGWIAARTT